MKKLFFISVMLLATMLACTKPEESGQTDEGAGKVTLLSESKVDVPVAGDIVTIKFKATDVWTAATDATWITLSVNKGDKGDECTVKASVVQNEEPDARLGVVTITCGKSTASVELAQRQASAFSFKPTKADVPAEG
ncbi:MAG: BACON domain-containing protein, partial [Bacteroidales bacterium]|nr:BACON domain-containing protein [Bacteroidales bacterium]